MRLQRIIVVLLFAAFAVCQLAAQEVIPGVHLVRGTFTPGSQPDGNSIIFDAPEGLVVVDTGRHAGHTQAIVDFASSEKRPLIAVVNTHWHLDHIGGNAMLRASYPNVRVYASDSLGEATKGFLARYRGQLEEIISKSTDAEEQNRYRSEITIIDSAPKLAPDNVLTKSGPVTLGGKVIDVNLERYAVTAGDVWLFDRTSGVVVSGDLVTLPVPFLDTACPARWRDALGRLDMTGFDLLIPGHGAPMTHRQFAVYRAAFGRLLDCAGGKAAKKDCVEGWLHDAAALDTTTDPKFARSLMDYYVDVLRKPASEIAPLCGK